MTRAAMGPEAKRNFRFLPAPWIATVLGFADRFSHVLVRLRISPNVLTVLGLLAGGAVGFFYAADHPGLAAALILACGVFDILDGKVATNADRRSLFGAMFDSSVDRYSEFLIYTGLAYHFRHGWGLWLMFFAFLGSTMVSYTRARAEGLGVDCRVGMMQRAERLVLLFLGTMVGIAFRVLDPAILAVMAFIAVISNFTAVQRIFYVRKFEKSRPSKEV
ncbi:MAG: CDP-alcohol phosphatidyltransferase family protein [Candidatus Aminicenantales bacterium]